MKSIVPSRTNNALRALSKQANASRVAGDENSRVAGDEKRISRTHFVRAGDRPSPKIFGS